MLAVCVLLALLLAQPALPPTEQPGPVATAQPVAPPPPHAPPVYALVFSDGSWAHVRRRRHNGDVELMRADTPQPLPRWLNARRTEQTLHAARVCYPHLLPLRVTAL